MLGGSPFSTVPFSSLIGNIYSVSVSETVTAADVNASAPTYACFISDSGWGIDPYGYYGWGLSGYSAAISDSVIGEAPVTYYIDMPEAAAISDENSSLPIYSNLVDESVVATDSLANIVTFLSAIDENAQASVADYVAAATFVSFFFDTVTAEDLSSVAALVWELIVTQQIASWQNIDDAQTPGWQTIGMTETSGWQDISSTQNSGWTLIDTEQADAWQVIDTPIEV